RLRLLLVAPPPPRPTLFPYTTLFRSGCRRTRRRRRAVVDEDGEWPLQVTTTNPGVPKKHVESVGVEPTAFRDPAAAAPRRSWHEDRKSTRLNSSHLGISYAVFCLKKK